jgi:hypothetical protein
VGRLTPVHAILLPFKKIVVTHDCTMPTIRTSLVDERVWKWVKGEIASPEVLERKLREIQDRQIVKMRPILWSAGTARVALHTMLAGSLGLSSFR